MADYPSGIEDLNDVATAAAWRSFFSRCGLPQPEAFQFRVWENGVVLESSASRVFFPGHDLHLDEQRWLDQAVALLDTLPSPADLATDPRAVAQTLFDRAPSGDLHCRLDLPGILYGFLDRREEVMSSARDEHGRWQPESSLLHDWLDVPLVDLLARGSGMILSEHLEIPGPDGNPPWRVAMTFDIDSTGHTFRAVPRDMVRSLRARGPLAAVRAGGRGVALAMLPRRDRTLDLDAIALRLESFGLKGLFFSQSLYRSRWDDYELAREPRLVRALRRLRVRGHLVGLHGSYVTADHGGRFVAAQREHLARLAGGPVDQYRSHYLRTREPGEMDRLLGPSGIREDWSAGYSSHEGFRLGTAHPVETLSGVTMQPLHLMDVTLRYHRHLSAEVALAVGIRLLSRVKSVGGTAAILWHPHNMSGPLWPGLWPEVPWELARWARENGARDAFA